MLGFLLLEAPNILIQEENPQILAGIGVGYRKSGHAEHKSLIPLKRKKIVGMTAYIKSCAGYRFLQMYDLELFQSEIQSVCGRPS